MSIKTLRYGKEDQIYIYYKKQFSKKIEIGINIEDVIYNYEIVMIYEIIYDGLNNRTATLKRIMIDNDNLNISNIHKDIYNYWRKNLSSADFKIMQKDIYHIIDRIINKVELFLNRKNIEC